MFKSWNKFKFNHLSNIPSHLGRFSPAIYFWGYDGRAKEWHEKLPGCSTVVESTELDRVTFYIAQLKKNMGLGEGLSFLAYKNYMILYFPEVVALMIALFFFMWYTIAGNSKLNADGVQAYKITSIIGSVLGMFLSILVVLQLSNAVKTMKAYSSNVLYPRYYHWFQYGGKSKNDPIREFALERADIVGNNYSFSHYNFNNMIVHDHFTIFMKGFLFFSAAIFFFIFFRKVRNIYFFNDKTVITNVDKFYLQVGLIASLSLFFLSILISSNSLLSLFVSLEGATLCLYILAGLRSDKRLSVEAGLKYFLTSAVFSCIFGLGLFMIYFSTGATDFLSIRESLLVLAEQGYNANISYFTYYTKLDYLAVVGTFLVIVVFLMKLGSVPFHFWIGDIYQGSPTIVTTFFATIVRISFFAVFFKLIIHTFFFVKPYLMPLLFFSGVAAVLVGSFLTLFQYEVKRFLANSSIVHTGFIVLGLSTMTFEGFKSSILYTVVYLFTLLCFLGIIVFYPVSTVRDYKKWGAVGLKKIDTMQANVFAHLQQLPFGIKLFFAFLLFSMAGLPPFPGFIIKLYTLKAVFEKLAVDKLSYVSNSVDYSVVFNFGSNFLFVLVILISLLTAYNYIRIIILMLFGKDALNEVEFDKFIYTFSNTSYKRYMRVSKNNFMFVLIAIFLHFVLMCDLSSFYNSDTFNSVVSACYHPFINKESIYFGSKLMDYCMMDPKGHPESAFVFGNAFQSNILDPYARIEAKEFIATGQMEVMQFVHNIQDYRKN